MAALLLAQFRDFMIGVLLAAALVSGLVGKWVDMLVIVVIVVLNALIGVAQAWRAERAMAALRMLAQAQATVMRDGMTSTLDAEALVPGDIVLLDAGCQVPADLRLLEVVQLHVDESALTGESVTVPKVSDVLAEDAPTLGDRLNMAYKGTSVTQGRGRGVVLATGMSTELGKLAGLLAQDSERSTPLQKRLAALGQRMAWAVMFICALVFAVGVLRGEGPLHMILVAVSLAVAAIPEALPAVVTVLLALGAHKMVAVHVLVKRLSAVETLGSVSIICTDKTGTLTQNRMHVEHITTADGQDHDLKGWQPDVQGHELLRAVTLCNNAQPSANGSWQGDPTETALVDAAHSLGLSKLALDDAHPRAHEHAFDASHKRMSTYHPAPSGYVLYTKGAPEAVIPLCHEVWSPSAPLPLHAAQWLERADAMAQSGLRVLAVARMALPTLPDDPNPAVASKGQMQLLGLVGMMDPPRPEVVKAVQSCLHAGIRPIMITGDHPATALAIAQRVGIAPTDAARSNLAGPVMTGAALATLDAAALQDRLAHTSVYARVDPAQKIRIVQALQAQGHFVAMTGDGVNDAPALQCADIGVAMGKAGTDVAREAASLVLLDDNFASIVRAVREGRRIYDNIRKFVRYAMTGNSGEIWTIFLAPLLGLPLPLLPIHILWINLVTDGLPGLALAAERAEPGVMQRPPRPPDESLFAGGLWQHVLGFGLLMGGLCLAVQAWALSSPATSGQAQTMVFTVLTFCQMAHVLAIRSERESLMQLGLFSNRPLLGAVLMTLALQLATLYIPVLQPIFKTVPLGAAELALCVAAAGVVYAAVELEKLWRRR
jgi:Ca2+-transporting ATPase